MTPDEIAGQLRLRASRKCADGYAIPFDAELDNMAAELIEAAKPDASSDAAQMAREIVFLWLRDVASPSVKMSMKPADWNALSEAIAAAIRAERVRAEKAEGMAAEWKALAQQQLSIIEAAAAEQDRLRALNTEAEADRNELWQRVSSITADRDRLREERDEAFCVTAKANSIQDAQGWEIEQINSLLAATRAERDRLRDALDVCHKDNADANRRALSETVRADGLRDALENALAAGLPDIVADAAREALVRKTDVSPFGGSILNTERT